jgi:hypothetical protein
MAKVSWIQIVLDIADAYREASGTTEKIKVGNLPNLIRQGVGEIIETTVTAGIKPFRTFAEKGKPFGVVTVNRTPSKQITVTAGTSEKTVTHDADSLIASVKVEPTPSQTKVATPTKDTQVITPDIGYHLSSVTVSGDNNLVPECIAKGKKIFGVLGTHVGGINPEDMGYTKMSIQKLKFAADTKTNEKIPHNLGETPKFVLLKADMNGNFLYDTTSSIESRFYTVYALHCSGFESYITSLDADMCACLRSGRDEVKVDTSFSYTLNETIDATHVKLWQYGQTSASQDVYYHKDVEYTLIALA